MKLICIKDANMEKYNYDFIADQEPDGNSEWYPAKEMDKETERMRKEIKNAYLEGYHDGHTSIGNKFGWERSNAKRIFIIEQALKEKPPKNIRKYDNKGSPI